MSDSFANLMVTWLQITPYLLFSHKKNEDIILYLALTFVFDCVKGSCVKGSGIIMPPKEILHSNL